MNHSQITGLGGAGVAILIFAVQAAGVNVPSFFQGAFVMLALGMISLGIKGIWKPPGARLMVNSTLMGAAELVETDIPYERLSREGKSRRLNEAAVALQDMYFHHGHADTLGIMDAVRTGKSFNAEACWICHQDRFEWVHGLEPG